MRMPARISSINQETPSVKSFRLDLGNNDFKYRSGQWIDLFMSIGGVEMVGGYSITSNPARVGYIDLAVKFEGNNPVTRHLHTDIRVGDAVEIQRGGDFYYTRDMADSVVLLGGGIGLTPLMSIIRYVDENASDTILTLIYSARTVSELLFREELDLICKRNSRISRVLTVTRPERGSWQGRVGRIDRDLLIHEIVDLQALFYICGPPNMIQHMLTLLQVIGVAKSRIRYEKWW